MFEEYFMARSTVERKMHLEEMFADRVTFDKTERKLYSHDPSRKGLGISR